VNDEGYVVVRYRVDIESLDKFRLKDRLYVGSPVVSRSVLFHYVWELVICKFLVAFHLMLGDS
jgi:hypothetical protein